MGGTCIPLIHIFPWMWHVSCMFILLFYSLPLPVAHFNTR